MRQAVLLDPTLPQIACFADRHITVRKDNTGAQTKTTVRAIEGDERVEEIAEMIGTTRETVSRLLKDFKTKNLISLKGSDLTIHDRDKLEAIIGTTRQKTRSDV